MKKACAILLLCLAFYVGYAQQGFQLVGMITDSAGHPLSRATVQLIDNRDTAAVLTGDDGKFGFSGVAGHRVRLLVTNAGYHAFSRGYSLAGSRTSYLLPPVALRTAYLDLDPVTVSRIRPVTIVEDTVSYHAAAFPVMDGSEVEDILKRLPGVEVNLEGNVIVRGRKLEKVLVNGKEFFGGDVLLAIRNLPADVVEKLQIIDDYGDKARLTGIKTGEPGKILNIVLKMELTGW